VLDCVAGYLVYLQALAGRPGTPLAMNFGPKPDGQQVTVGELATLGVQALGARPWRHEPDEASIEARSLAIDASLAREVLGFESRHEAPGAVELTMDWYRRQADGEPALDLCREQIAAYEGQP
jgi:CDP-glucose 4,6-dehydratase